MDLKLKTHYWNDPDALAAFKKFILKIHNLDFTKWASGGFWDNAYTPFSFFKDDVIVAGVCVYMLNAIINGKKTCLAQISGVGTLPEWRRKGLNKQLTEIGLNWAKGKHEGIFLFADTDAIPYYKKSGFRPLDEFVETMEVTPLQNCGGLVKLNPGNNRDMHRIYEYAKKRAPVSDKFSVLNAKLIMFHVLYDLPDCVYEITDLNCLVFYKRAKGILTIYDIVGERIPHLDEFYPYIADKNDKVIEFHFHTDKLGLRKTRTRQLSGNNPFVKGRFPMEMPVFPFISRA